MCLGLMCHLSPLFGLFLSTAFFCIKEVGFLQVFFLCFFTNSLFLSLLLQICVSLFSSSIFKNFFLEYSFLYFSSSNCFWSRCFFCFKYLMYFWSFSSYLFLLQVFLVFSVSSSSSRLAYCFIFFQNFHKKINR